MKRIKWFLLTGALLLFANTASFASVHFGGGVSVDFGFGGGHGCGPPVRGHYGAHYRGGYRGHHGYYRGYSGYRHSGYAYGGYRHSGYRGGYGYARPYYGPRYYVPYGPRYPVAYVSPYRGAVLYSVPPYPEHHYLQTGRPWVRW
ncbi:MAG: hypothetical protein HYV68_01045 [Candidatus Taylorbacteria bacterium]|nr:hypothetical protein [Candidatus Taylorbacteria bacterium]